MNNSVDKLNTKIFNVIKSENLLGQQEIFNECAELILKGGLVASPTETVYGLCANALNPKSVKNTYRAKGRPSDNPLIVHIDSYDMLNMVTKAIPENAKKLMDKFWPGPLTIILPKTKIIPYETTANLETVAVRFPSNSIILNLISTCKVPLSAPSANTSTRPSPTKASHVFQDLNGKIDAIIDGGTCDFGVESTVIDFSTNTPTILRPGFITYEMIKEVLPKVDINNFNDSTLNKVDINSTKNIPKSPGTKYKHYAPNCTIFVVNANTIKEIAYNINKLAYEDVLNSKHQIGILATSETFHNYDTNKFFVINLGSRQNLTEISKNLFDSFRLMEKNNITKVFAEHLGEKNEASAIMNRLNKASGYKILNFKITK